MTSRAACTRFGLSVSIFSSASLSSSAVDALDRLDERVARDVDPQVHRVHARRSAPSRTARAPRAAGRAGCWPGTGRRRRCEACESLGSKCSKTLSCVSSVSRELRSKWYSPAQKNVLPSSTRSMSSVFDAAAAQHAPPPRARSRRRRRRPRGPRRRTRRRARSGWRRRRACARAAERGLDGVEGDGSDHGEAHGSATIGSAATMRAIQIQEFGGPEVLAARRHPRARAGRGRGAHPRLARGDELRRHAPRARTATWPRPSCRSIPGGEVAGVREDTGERVVALIRQRRLRRGRASRPRRWRSRCPTASTRAPRWRCSSRASTAWHLLPHRRAACAEGETVVVHAAAGGTGSLAVQLGKAFGAGPGDRHRVDRGQARARARARRRRGDRRRRRGHGRADHRGQRRRAGRRRPRDGRRRGLRGVDARRSRRSGGWSPTASPRASRTRSAPGSSCAAATPSSASG